jgi:hypothetical protein
MSWVVGAVRDGDFPDDSGEKRGQRRSMDRSRRRCCVELGHHSQVGVIRNGNGHSQARLDEWLIWSLGRLAPIAPRAAPGRSRAQAIHPLPVAMSTAPTG